MNDFGFKKLSVENWRQPDPIMSTFVKVDRFGQTYKSNNTDWVQAILKPELKEFVPDEVRALFEVARGSMAYGYFFYPLFTLSAEQIFRVAEAAIKYKCKELNAPTAEDTFYKRINWLMKAGVIDKTNGRIWHGTKKLRNYASHPSKQMILTPGDALAFLLSTAEDINSLFNNCQHVA